MNMWKLEPQLVTAMWGGRRLAPLYDWPYAEPLAEAWLASDLEHRPTIVADGEHQGQPLRQALGYDFPILVKLIDAQSALSVQVHPDDAQARARGVHSNGKTEAWVVLHAEPGGRIYAGLRAGLTGDDLRAALDRGAVDSVLHSFEPRVGDIAYLPAGTIHALGGGVAVFEVQQSCDVTYRLHDWGRVDPQTGQSRPLHVDDALACADLASGPVRPIRTGHLHCDYFDLTIHRGPVTIGGDGRPRLLAAYGGQVTGCVDMAPGRAVFIPASDGECRLTPDPGAWLFEVSWTPTKT